MTKKRLWQTFRLWTLTTGAKRVAYLRKQKIFGMIGENVLIMDRKIPLYANLIRIHNNVRIASNVTFVTHDVTHRMLNCKFGTTDTYLETLGCIEIMDNVFVGSNTTILSNVRIGENCIVAAGSVVTKDVPANSVVGGVPARVICSFDEYLAKRKNPYPHDLAPKQQEVSLDLEKLMWENFAKQRMS